MRKFPNYDYKFRCKNDWHIWQDFLKSHDQKMPFFYHNKNKIP